MRQAFLAAAAMLLAVGAAHAEDWSATEGWFTLHHDAMRSGRTNYSPGAPFRYVWHHKFWDGMISPEVEPIVAEDLVFVGTWGGRFFALDAYTGAEKWSAPAGGGVRHSPCYADGRIYFATVGDQAGGAVVCLKARTGEPVWEFRPGTRGGFAASPMVYRGRVYLGGRDRVLYCVDAATGEKKWTYQAAAPFLQSCAARDGRVVVSAEDMVARSFDAETGRQVWESAAMDGDTVRFYYPVFWRDTVILRTAAPEGAINEAGSVINASDDGKKRREVFAQHQWTKPYFDYNDQMWTLFTPEKYRKEQEDIRQAIASGRLHRTFFMLNAADGKQRMVTSVTYAGSENGCSTPTPPPVDFHDNLYVLHKSLYTQYEFPIRADDCIGTLDYDTGLPTMLPRDKPSRSSLFTITADETNMFIVGGEKLYNCHDHNFVYYDMKTHKVTAGFAPKKVAESWGGVLLSGRARFENLPDFHLENPAAMMKTNNEWNGTSCGSVAIYKNYVWWRTGNMIVCIQGVEP